MLVIYGIARSRAFRCLWTAEETGLPYRHEPTPPSSAEARSVNPSGKMPALRDGELLMSESLAINLHLGMKVGAPLLPPGDDTARVLQWTLWAATELEPHIMQWAANTFMKPAAQRDAALAAAGRAATEARLSLLGAALGDRPHLLGEFSLADLNIAGVLYGSWFQGYDLSGQPVVKAWMERCMTRPAALRARRMREG